VEAYYRLFAVERKICTYLPACEFASTKTDNRQERNYQSSDKKFKPLSQIGYQHRESLA
jgi:hypothetical protein